MNPRLELKKSLLLTDFPSGSSINYYDDKLYLIGDDANHILILNRDYEKLSDIHLFDYPGRIPKPEKADFETSTLITRDDQDYLIVIGSASRELRMKLMLFPLQSTGSVEIFQYGEFIKRLKVQGITEINIESATVIGNHFVLGNRGHQAMPVNHLIFTENNFWLRQRKVKFSASTLDVSTKDEDFLGVSELCYVASKDLLLLTLTSEMTSNSYDDGLIGDSYLGWIESITDKINSPHFKLDGKLKLCDVGKELDKEKIEGICVESLKGNELVLHLIADNDLGQTKLFKVKMEII